MFSDDEIVIEFQPIENEGKKVWIRCFNPRTKDPMQPREGIEVTRTIPVGGELCIEILQGDVFKGIMRDEKPDINAGGSSPSVPAYLPVLEGLNKEFQETHIKAKNVVMIIPTSVMCESQKKLRTYFNRISEKTCRKEKLHILDVDNLSDGEKTKKIIETIEFFQSQGYEVVAAVDDVKDIDQMLGHNVRSLAFKDRTDIYFVMTCLRTLYRKRLDSLIRLYEMYTGSKFNGEIPDPSDGEAFARFINAIIFFIPEARKVDHELEVMDHNKKIKLFMLSA